MEDLTYYLAQEKAKEVESSPSKKGNWDMGWQKIRINTGVAFSRWKLLMRDKCFQSDADVACFLLDR